MLSIQDFAVSKSGRTICQVDELVAAPGEHVVVVGVNGCGKTTLLRAIAGFETDFRGKLNAASFQKIVYLHQQPYLFRGTALSNVLYGIRSVANESPREHAKHWLDVFGGRHLANQRCDLLSGGEARRVALARTFATKADLILLDEPAADLDDAGAALVRKAIGEAKATVIWSTPTSPNIADTDRVFRLTQPK